MASVGGFSFAALRCRENVDKSRTHLNYTLGVYEKDGKRFIGKVRGSASWATVKGRIDAVNARAKQ